MPLTRGTVIGYDAGRMMFAFTMITADAMMIRCEISSVAMDDLAGKRGTSASDREALFLHLRTDIERMPFSQRMLAILTGAMPTRRSSHGLTSFPAARVRVAPMPMAASCRTRTGRARMATIAFAFRTNGGTCLTRH